MTTDHRGGHITIAYLAGMDDQQLRDINTKLNEVLESWWSRNEHDTAEHHYLTRPVTTAEQREVWKIRHPPLQDPQDNFNKKLYNRMNILDLPFDEVQAQSRTGEIRMSYPIHDYTGRPLNNEKAAHVAYSWAADQRYDHYLDEVNSVHSIHQPDDPMKFVYLGTSGDNKLAQGSELRTLCNYLRTALRKF